MSICTIARLIFILYISRNLKVWHFEKFLLVLTLPFIDDKYVNKNNASYRKRIVRPLMQSILGINYLQIKIFLKSLLLCRCEDVSTVNYITSRQVFATRVSRCRFLNKRDRGYCKMKRRWTVPRPCRQQCRKPDAPHHHLPQNTSSNIYSTRWRRQLSWVISPLSLCICISGYVIGNPVGILESGSVLEKLVY